MKTVIILCWAANTFICSLIQHALKMSRLESTENIHIIRIYDESNLEECVDHVELI